MFETFKNKMQEVVGGRSAEKGRRLFRTELAGGSSLDVYETGVIELYGEKRKRLSLIISSPDGTRIPFNELLAPAGGAGSRKNLQYVRSEKFQALIEDDVIEVNIDDLKDPRHIFSLLHEEGHFADAASWSENERIENAAISKRYHHEHSLPDSELVLQKERNAWAAGIRMARNIKNTRGMDLFSAFSSAEDFAGWMRMWGLRTHETDAARHGAKDAYSRGEAVRRWKAAHPDEERKLYAEHPERADDETFATARETKKTMEDINPYYAAAMSREPKLTPAEAGTVANDVAKKHLKEFYENH